MSDELDTVAKVGGIAGGGGAFVAFGVWLAKRFVRKSDRLEAEEKAAMVAALLELKAENKQLRERIEGGLGAHRAQLEAEKDARHALALKVQDHETRLLTREGRGGEPMTSPGFQLSPELAAAIARSQEPK